MQGETNPTGKIHDITQLNKRRAVVMLLGNQCDIPSLVSMLEKEEDPRLLHQIIATLGSLGKVECIPHLEKMMEKVQDTKLLESLESAISTINKISSYGQE